MNKTSFSPTTIVLSLIAVALLVGFSMFHDVKASGASTATQACTASSTLTVIGHQASTEILQSKGRRAYALIQQPLNATNTVAISVTSSNAVIGSGIMLANATTSQAKTSLEVGLNTDLAYTGAVKAITSTGSTTILVTECIY